jgi:DNA-binding PadR family transcriptional regulator
MCAARAAGFRSGFDPDAIRAIKALLKLGLIQVAGVTGKRQWKLYRLTQMGQRVLNQLQQ